MRRTLLTAPPPTLQPSGRSRTASAQEQEGATDAPRGSFRASRTRTRSTSAVEEAATTLLSYPSTSINPVYDDLPLTSYPPQGAAIPSNTHEGTLVEVQLTQTAAPEQHMPMGLSQSQVEGGPQYHSSPYSYNLETGLLEQQGSRLAERSKLAKVFIEDRSTGDFHRVRSESDGCCSCCWHPPADPQHQPWQGMQGGSLRQVVEALANGLSTAGLCAQGLLGGLSLLVLAMTYIVYAGSPMTAFLQYYGPLALVVNRSFYVLISMSLIACCARYAHDKLVAFQPSALRLRLLDVLSLLAYLLAYAATILATPTEDQLSYESSRDLAWWRGDLGQGFARKMQLWHVLNVIRLVTSAAGWLMLCYRLSPSVLHQELSRDQARLAAARELGVVGAH